MLTKIIPTSPLTHQGPLLIKSILKASQRFEPDNEIIYKDISRYNYRKFYERVCRQANLLRDAGVKAGDVVAFADWDSHRFLEAYFAIPMIGAILHHINVRLSDEQILYTINHAEDKLIFVFEDFIPTMERIKDRFDTDIRFIIMSDSTAPSTSLPVLGEYEDLMASSDSNYDFKDFDENSVATTFYTTGTTGNPKGVMFSHRQLVLHTLSLMGFCGAYASLNLFRSDDIYMPITPMFHVHAWGMPYLATMLGTQQVYPGRYEPDHLVNLIVKEKVTFSHCVPTILQMILQSKEAQKVSLSGWKLVIGGSAMPQSLAIKAMERGIEVYSGYGMSETCPVIGVTHLNREKQKLDKMEQVPYRTRLSIINMADIEILDANGQPQPHDGKSVGELVIQAPWLTVGYLKQPEETEELWQAGWLHTGDIACIHPDGMLEIKDRVKDVIKTGGEWISSLELENLISQHEAVESVAVVGIPDDEWGERPCALITLINPSSPVDGHAIREHLMGFVNRGVINKWWIPEYIKFVEDIPKTSVGKIDKKKIRGTIND